MQNKNYDLFAKIIIVGDAGVGKTNIMKVYSGDEFKLTNSETIGVDFKIKTTLIGDSSIMFQIWDTAGQEKFESIIKNYYKNALGVLFN